MTGSKVIKELFVRKCINEIKSHLVKMKSDKLYSLTMKDVSRKLFANKFQLHTVADFFREATMELRDETDGKLNFRWDVWLFKYRWFNCSNDSIQLTDQQNANIDARKHNQNVDYDLSTSLYSGYKSSIKIIKTPGLQTDSSEIDDIKTEHTKRFDGVK